MVVLANFVPFVSAYGRFSRSASHVLSLVPVDGGVDVHIIGSTLGVLLMAVRTQIKGRVHLLILIIARVCVLKG